MEARSVNRPESIPENDHQMPLRITPIPGPGLDSMPKRVEHPEGYSVHLLLKPRPSSHHNFLHRGVISFVGHSHCDCHFRSILVNSEHIVVLL